MRPDASGQGHCVWLGRSDPTKNMNWGETPPSLCQATHPSAELGRQEGMHLLICSTDPAYRRSPPCLLTFSGSGLLETLHPKNLSRAFSLAQVYSPWQFLSLMRSL